MIGNEGGFWKFCFLEPIGSSPPRLPPRSKFDGMMKVQGQAVTLLCEAQGSPIPFFR